MRVHSIVKAAAFLLAALSLNVSSYALDKAGNGSDAYLCEGVRPELLDFRKAAYDPTRPENIYEATELHYTEILNEIFKKIERFSPDLAEKYRTRAESLFSDIKKLEIAVERNPELMISTPLESKAFHGEWVTFTPDRLSNRRDEGGFQTPEGCRVEQLVLQYRESEPHQSLYLIRGDIFLDMDEVNKAGTILHEIIYRDYIIGGWDSTSKSVQRLTRYYFDENVESDTLYDYLAYLNINNFKEIKVGNYRLDNFFIDRSGGIGTSCTALEKNPISVRGLGGDFKFKCKSPGRVTFTVDTRLQQGDDKFFIGVELLRSKGIIFDPSNSRKLSFFRGIFNNKKEIWKIRRGAIEILPLDLDALYDPKEMGGNPLNSISECKVIHQDNRFLRRARYQLIGPKGEVIEEAKRHCNSFQGNSCKYKNFSRIKPHFFSERCWPGSGL